MASTVRMDPFACPQCTYMMNTGTNPYSSGLSLGPQDGSRLLCINCASVLIYEDGAPRLPTATELVTALMDPAVANARIALRHFVGEPMQAQLRREAQQEG